MVNRAGTRGAVRRGWWSDWVDDGRRTPPTVGCRTGGTGVRSRAFGRNL